MIEKKAVEITVKGKVQGVWFRASTQKKAIALNICGTVENKNDGTVFIKAEGIPQKLETLISWCHEGSPHSRVSEVNVYPGDLLNFNSFEILR